MVNSKVTSCKGVSGKKSMLVLDEDVKNDNMRMLASIDYSKDTVIYATKPIFKTICFPISPSIQKTVMG